MKANENWRRYVDLPLPVERHPVVAAIVAQQPKLAFRRYIETKVVSKSLGRMRGQCRWCGKPATPPMVAWCSRECREECYTEINDCEKAFAVRERDGHKCVLCDRPAYEVDHIVPVILGGGLCSLSNLRTLCKVCHPTQTKLLGERLREMQRARAGCEVQP